MANNEVIEFAYGRNADLYDDVLRVPANATMDDIRTAFFDRRYELYQLLSSADSNADNGAMSPSQRHFTERRMDAVVSAFRILNDPDRRAEYDARREEQKKERDDTVERMVVRGVQQTLSTSSTYSTTMPKGDPAEEVIDLNLEEMRAVTPSPPRGGNTPEHNSPTGQGTEVLTSLIDAEVAHSKSDVKQKRQKRRSHRQSRERSEVKDEDRSDVIPSLASSEAPSEHEERSVATPSPPRSRSRKKKTRAQTLSPMRSSKALGQPIRVHRHRRSHSEGSNDGSRRSLRKIKKSLYDSDSDDDEGQQTDSSESTVESSNISAVLSPSTLETFDDDDEGQQTDSSESTVESSNVSAVFSPSTLETFDSEEEDETSNDGSHADTYNQVPGRHLGTEWQGGRIRKSSSMSAETLESASTAAPDTEERDKVRDFDLDEDDEILRTNTLMTDEGTINTINGNVGGGGCLSAGGGDGCLFTVAQNRTVKSVTEEIRGSFQDTIDAVDQVWNAFSLTENDINGFMGTIRHAKAEIVRSPDGSASSMKEDDDDDEEEEDEEQEAALVRSKKAAVLRSKSEAVRSKRRTTSGSKKRKGQNR